MNVEFPKPGRYVVAVSGGVDSMTLLNMLSNQPGLELVAAHFDHGIRDDSERDRLFVQQTAGDYGLEFAYAEGGLGPDAGEAEARQARYAFLRQVLEDVDGQAIITAHHQDDVLETAILNMLRGTGRKGLTSLRNRLDITRPLLKVPKAELLDYAKENKLEWREDSTNADTAYSRNYVRHQILPRFDASDRSELVNILTKLTVTNQDIDDSLAEQLGVQSQAMAQGGLDRQWFNGLPHQVAKEVMAAWLRANGVAGFDSKALERLVVAAKTGAAGKTFPVRQGARLAVHADRLALDS